MIEMERKKSKKTGCNECKQKEQIAYFKNNHFADLVFCADCHTSLRICTERVAFQIGFDEFRNTIKPCVRIKL
jgi:hypothetical protein